MSLFSKQRRPSPLVIGMLHLLPLPGSPGWSGSMEEVLEMAIAEAKAYRSAGIDAVLVENMHDVPYLKGRVEPETTAAMAIVARAVKSEVGELPVGIQLLAGANREALGAAIAAGADFVRAEGFAYAHVADEGVIDACAGELLRARAALGAKSIEILADIKKKHSAHALTADVDIVEMAQGTEFCRADGLILTGTATGSAADPAELNSVRAKTDLPILIGSGITHDNVKQFDCADGLIVGSSFKRDGRWVNSVEPARVESLLRALGR